MTENSPKIITHLWGEPVTRPDGRTLTISVYEISGSVQITLGGLGVQYSRDQVKNIGEGNYTAGIVNIGQAYYKLPIEDMRPGSTKLFSNKFNTDND